MRKLLSACVAIWGITTPLWAYFPATAAPTPDFYLSQQPLDSATLRQAVKSFWQNATCTTQANLKIIGTSTGISFTGQAQVKSIAQLPNKFRVEIEFAPKDTGESQSALLVSDGITLWIYRPDLRQYMETQAEAFRNSDDSFWVGFSTVFYLSMPPDVQTMLLAGGDAAETVLTAILEEVKGLNITQGKGKLDGVEMDTLSLTNKAQGVNATVYLAPPQAELQAIDLKTQEEGLAISMNERIQQRDCQAQVPPETFRFVPPAAVQKVDQVKISPF